MKEKAILSSKKLELLSGKSKIEFESDTALIAANLYTLLSSRIDKYMLQIPEYKSLPLEEWDEKKAHLNIQARNRFSAFIKRKLIGLSEFADFMISEKEYLVAVWEFFENKVEEFYITIDEILCSIEPKFEKVVEYRHIDATMGEKENRIEKIEKLFQSLENVKSITRFYLYVAYFIHSENLKVKESINKTISFLKSNIDKDIEDLKNNYSTWQSDNPDLMDSVFEIVPPQK